MAWANDGEQIIISAFRAWMAVILAFAAGYGLCVLDVIVILTRNGYLPQ